MNKKITHIGARFALVQEAKGEKTYNENQSTLSSYISQQEHYDKARGEVFKDQEAIIKKQEQLLELYKEKIKVLKRYYELPIELTEEINTFYKLLIGLDQQIEELENEEVSNKTILEPIPDYGTLFTYEKFLRLIEGGYISKYDGMGSYSDGTYLYDDIDVDNLTDTYSHIMWFNN